MRLVEDWKQAWRWYSTHALVIATAAPLAVSETEQYLGHEMPLWAKGAIAGAILVSGLVGRIIDQKGASS